MMPNADSGVRQYVEYIHREARGTLLGLHVCVNPPSIGEYLKRTQIDAH